MSFLNRIVAFFMAIIAFISGLFSGSGKKPEKEEPKPSVTYEFRDESYGSHERQLYDLLLPEGGNTDTLYLYIHGGAWITGDKSAAGGILSTVASMGYAAAAINYRYVSPTTDMGDLLDDIGAALAAIKKTAADNGFDLKKVVLSGVSAGAHLSLLYAYKCAASSPLRPSAVISYCGPTKLDDADFIEHNSLGGVDDMLYLLNMIAGVTITREQYDAKSGSYAQWQQKLLEYSPVTYVTPSCCPTLMGHGKVDTIVPFSNAQALDALLTSNGVDHDFVVYENSGHDLDADPESGNTMYVLSLDYIKR